MTLHFPTYILHTQFLWYEKESIVRFCATTTWKSMNIIEAFVSPFNVLDYLFCQVYISYPTLFVYITFVRLLWKHQVFQKLESWAKKWQEGLLPWLRSSVRKTVVLSSVLVVSGWSEIASSSFSIIATSINCHEEGAWAISMCILKLHLGHYSKRSPYLKLLVK